MTSLNQFLMLQTDYRKLNIEFDYEIDSSLYGIMVKIRRYHSFTVAAIHYR